jgi:hypothetical protein
MSRPNVSARPPGGPYRQPAPGPVVTAPAPAPGVVARRTAAYSAVPLAVMALAFVLPTVQACHDDPTQSALDVALEDGARKAPWVAPPYLAALVLAVVTIVALRRRRSPGKAWAYLSAGLLATGVATSLTVPWQMAVEATEAQASVVLPILAMVGAAGLCAVWIVRALRKGGWARWSGLLGAHALLAAPLGILLGMLAGGDELRVGAYVYVGALSALVTIRVAGRVLSWQADRSLRRGHASLAGVAGG